MGDESGLGHGGDVGGLGPSAWEGGAEGAQGTQRLGWQREAESESTQAEGCEKGREDSVGMEEWGDVHVAYCWQTTLICV